MSKKQPATPKRVMAPSPVEVVPPDYERFLADVKARIQSAQVRATLAVNAELVQLYWTIGRDILARQREQGWGAKIVQRLADDLRAAFPGVGGFSRANLMYMRAFAAAYPDLPFVQRAVGQIPWGHNIALIERVKDPTERLWYAGQSVAYGWSRAVLVHQIESDLYSRQGKAANNFQRTLPPPQSDLARELLKDPYHFDFLTLAPDAVERELENGLLDHVQKFLLELGTGFAFVGRQVPLEVDGEDFFLDLLFYHLRLRCFIVIDLKTGDFKPEHGGKMNFYLSAVDDRLKHATDQPSIGLILCKTAKKTIAEYALRDLAKPVGVTPHVLKRMTDRGCSETGLRLMLESASGYRPSSTAGRFVILRPLEAQSWEVVVEPDESLQSLLIITAYRKEPR